MRDLKPPILGSIGTVLIDSFDRPPPSYADEATTSRRTASRKALDGPSISAFLDAIPTVRTFANSGYPSSLSSPTQSESACSDTAGTSARGNGHLSASTSSEPRLSPPPPKAGLTITAMQPTGNGFPHHANLSPTSTIATRLSGARTPQLDFGDSSSEASTPPEGSYDVLGGGALYALVGARMWLPADELRTLVDRKGKGRALPSDNTAPGDEDTEASGPEDDEDDLPKELEDRLNAFGRQIWVWNTGPKTRMTRARIRYNGDVRLFQHVVKAPKRTLASLIGTPVFGARYLHVAPPASPEDVCEMLEELRRYNADIMRVANGHPGQEHQSGRPWHPKIVFEPAPPSCHPDQKEWLERCLPGVTILSPNHEELLSIYSMPVIPFDDPAFGETLESIIKHILALGVGPDGEGAVVVRCGKMGSCVGTRRRGLRWFPAGFSADEEHRVRDVTGAGNAFLGGYVAGLSLSDDDPYEAALYATMSSSFTIEQFGLPDLQRLPDGTEEWNGELPSERLARYRARLRALENGVDSSQSAATS